MPLNRIWTGTSNVVVPGNKTTFPAPFKEKSRLYYYGSLFNSVEINQTFYKLPLPATFERWAREVPEDFTFTIKLTREITHTKNLLWNHSCLKPFLHAVERLREKKGCLLLQFPGKISLDHFNEVESILEHIAGISEGKLWKKAVEFRNSSWHCGETLELLNSFKAAWVMQDMPKSKMMEDLTAAPFAYMRFHGPQGDYRGSYTNAFLEQLADTALSIARQKELFIYFNNTMGQAYQNAQLLIEKIRKL